MCRYKRQEEHPYVLTVAKALRGKKEFRSGEDGKGRRKGLLDPLAWGRQKNMTGGQWGLPYGPHDCAKRSIEEQVEPRQRVHYL